MFSTFDHVASSVTSLLESSRALKSIPGILQDINNTIRVQIQVMGPVATKDKIQIMKDIRILIQGEQGYAEALKESLDLTLNGEPITLPLTRVQGDSPEYTPTIGVLDAFDLLRLLDERGWTDAKIVHVSLRGLKGTSPLGDTNLS